MTTCRKCEAPVPDNSALCPACGSFVGTDADSGELETQAITHWSQPAGSPGDEQVLAAGTIIGGRYEVLRMLGQGGMGSVCQARDLEVDRLVALKIIRSDLAGKAWVLQRFKRELVLAQRVTHPNVVRIYDLGVAGEMRFITMEYIDGYDLRKMVDERGKLPARDAAGLMLQVCRGLSAAHAVGIVHRDLKPANIMVDHHGRVAVMDFGIARSMGNAAEEEDRDGEARSAPAGELTRLGQVVGTPIYMSPEQARRQNVDHRSDLFTVGILLYSLISGNVPEAGSTIDEALKSRGRGRINPLIDVEPGVPPAVNEIVMKCLQAEPGRRYQSADELAKVLEGWLGGKDTGETAAIARPRKVGWIAAASVAAAGAGIAAFYTLVPSQKPVVAHSPVKVIVSDFTNSSGNPLLDGALEPMIAINLEGASFITVYNRGQAHRIANQLSGSPVLDVNASQLVARREGIDVVVTGMVSRQADKYLLSVRALDSATGRSIAEQSATAGSPEKLPHALGEVAAGIRKQLGDVTPVSVQIDAAETFSSHSLEAAKEYSDAQEFLWKAKLEDALAAYRRAIVKDPELGRAYAGLAATLANLGRGKDAEEMYRLAMSKIDRMSDREKYRTRGSYFLFRKDYDKAIEQFQALVKVYPSDTAGIANLALSNFYQRNMAAAVEVGRRAVVLSPANVLQENNLALYQMYAGEFEDAIRQFNHVLVANPAFEKAYVGLGLSNLALGKNPEANAALEKLGGLGARAASMAALARADAALYEGRVYDAVPILEAAIKTDGAGKEKDRAASKWIALADAQMSTGAKLLAGASANQAVTESPDNKILYSAALIYLNSGQESKARSMLAQLTSQLGPEPEMLAKLVEAEIKLQRHEYRESITLFQNAQKVSDSWLGRFGMGRAYLGAGAFTEADAEFEACVKRRGEATAVFLDDEPTYRYLPAVYYYQGRAKEGLASTGSADAYRTFLKIKEKSFGDALVDDARKHLAAISK